MRMNPCWCRLSCSGACTARSFGVYGMDLNTLRTACESVQGEGLREENGQLLGSFQAEEGDWLFVPVCNTGGLSAEVNGKEAEVVSVLDCFFAVPLEAGENQCGDLRFCARPGARPSARRSRAALRRCPRVVPPEKGDTRASSVSLSARLSCCSRCSGPACSSPFTCSR